MKIITSEIMKKIEEEAILQGSSESDFREEAGSGVGLHVHEFVEKYGLPRHVTLLGGVGSNSADGYIAAVHLLHLDYRVSALQLVSPSETRKETEIAIERFLAEGGEMTLVASEDDLVFPEEGLILDALFGTGFHGELKGLYKEACIRANLSGLTILSIDIPSGLNGSTGEASEGTIRATETSFLALPKKGFFLRQGPDHVGLLRYVDFGLPHRFIDSIRSPYEYLTSDLLLPLLPAIRRTRSKFDAGIVTILAGSPSMQGAPLLAAIGALRAGAGLVKLFCPYPEIQFGAYPLEIIKEVFDPEKPEKFLEWTNRSQACLIGPGLGRDDSIKKLLKNVLPKIRVPTVLDADGLDFIAHVKCTLPKKLILTPHRKEMEKLLKGESTSEITEKLLETCKAFARKKKAVLALKGWPTFLFSEEETVFINSTGDPGLATAGTGDVLAGIMAGLLAQGLTLIDSAKLAVFIHGLAGENAAQEKTPYCLIASDLFDFMPSAFNFEQG